MKNLNTATLLKKLGGLLLCAFLAHHTYAQEPLTLEQSLELARRHNVALLKAQHNATKALVAKRSYKFAYLPSINAGADASRVNGLTFDNVSGQVKRGNTTTSNPYVSAQLILFDGFAKYFELKQAAKQAEAGQHSLAQAEIDMEATVTGYFLQAILDKESVQIAQERMDLLQAQLEQMEKLERAGIRTIEDVYQLKSQLATEKLNLITNENNYRQSMLALVQSINAGPTASYTLLPPAANINITEEQPPLDSVISRALAYSPELKAAKANLEASKQGLKAVRSGLSPTLSLNGIVGSNYSSNIQNLNNETNLYSKVPYFDQLDQNQQKIVQLSLDIPLFSGFSNHFKVQTARIDQQNYELDYITTQNQLQQKLQQAYHDVAAAKEKYNTVTTNLAYTQKAFEAAKRKYESGTLDFYAYLEALNNKDQVQTELLQSKCEFYFKNRILELYQGN